jgi:NAD(P)-dependent dehydrogenase (short-subunit alcohol dehydrogenase family)
MGDGDSIRARVNPVVERRGALPILVNNAGITTTVARESASRNVTCNAVAGFDCPYWHSRMQRIAWITQWHRDPSPGRSFSIGQERKGGTRVESRSMPLNSLPTEWNLARTVWPVSSVSL